MLDSSPVLLDGSAPQPSNVRRPLKRKASTASLPTPPRTVNAKKRVRKFGPSCSDSEDEEGVTVASVARVLFPPNPSSKKASSKSALDDSVFDGEDSDDPVPQRSTLKKSSTIGSAPASPPPSRTNQLGPRFATPPPRPAAPTPETPVGKRGKAAVIASSLDSTPVIRDSPNNPFIASPSSPTLLTTPLQASPSLEDKPTLDYVHRGKRFTVANPLYNLPDAAFERSRLPLEHPEYSPPPVIKPKRLFVEEQRELRRSVRRRAASPTTPTRPSLSRRVKQKPVAGHT